MNRKDNEENLIESLTTLKTEVNTFKKWVWLSLKSDDLKENKMGFL